MPRVDRWLDNITFAFGLRWTAGDTSCIRGALLHTADNDTLPAAMIGTHVGTITNPETGATVATVTVLVSLLGGADVDDQVVLATVGSPQGVAAGEYVWSARQTIGDGTGITWFEKSRAVVERT